MKNRELDEQESKKPIDETETDLCRALWLAVAIQAMIDATSNSRKKSAIKVKQEALQWLSEMPEKRSEFTMVCDLAGINCDRLRKKFTRMLRNQDETIDFRCLKKAGIDNRETESRKRYFARVRKNELLRQERLAKQNADNPLAAATLQVSSLPSDSPKEMKLAS